MAKVSLCKKYRDGRIVSFTVDDSSPFPLENLEKEVKHQDEKYYDSINTSCSINDIFSSFEELCKSMEWD